MLTANGQVANTDGWFTSPVATQINYINTNMTCLKKVTVEIEEAYIRGDNKNYLQMTKNIEVPSAQKQLKSNQWRRQMGDMITEKKKTKELWKEHFSKLLYWERKVGNKKGDQFELLQDHEDEEYTTTEISLDNAEKAIKQIKHLGKTMQKCYKIWGHTQ